MRLFVSYAGADTAWAEWIAWQLERAGHEAIVQAWDFRPGENFVVQMRRALDAAERTLAVMSTAYLESVYGSDEWTAAFIHDRPEAMGLLVVRVEEVTLPRLLRPWIYVDLVGVDAKTAAQRLLEGLQTGRRKPALPPTFPRPPSRPGCPASQAEVLLSRTCRPAIRPSPVAMAYSLGSTSSSATNMATRTAGAVGRWR